MRLDYPIFNPGFCKYIFKENPVGVSCRPGGAEPSLDLSLSITSIHSLFILHTLHFLSFTLHMLCHFAKCDMGRLGHSLAGLLTYLFTKHQLQPPPLER